MNEMNKLTRKMIRGIVFKALSTVCSLHWNCLLDLQPFGYQ